jgi:predicted TIM-barrel fold metal-dependent hydrolase
MTTHQLGTQPTDQHNGDRALDEAVIDVDVHQVMKSHRDLVPYLDEPWRSRVAIPNGWEGPPSFVYSYPQIGGVARVDAETPDGAPAGSDFDLLHRQLLESYPIEHAVLTNDFYPTDIPVQPDFATAIASAYNDWVIENWLERDARLHGSIAIAAQSPQDAAREIDRVGPHPQMVQVMLPATSRDVLGREFYTPVYEAAVRNELVVGFHQTSATQTAVGLPPNYVEWHTAIPQAWQCQLIGLILNGMFDRLPDLRVALIEGGWTWVPWLMWRLDLNYRSLRREVPWVKRMPSEYIKENVGLATQPMEYPDDPALLYRMFEMVGTDRFLMFSTDYPHWDFDSPERALPHTFPTEVRRKILHDNAADFYRLG